MNLSALRFFAAWPETVAFATQIVDRHAGASGRAPRTWSATDRADEATSTAMVLLTTSAGQAERICSAGVAVVLAAMGGDLLIDTAHDRLGTYRFTSVAQDDAFDVRFVTVFGAALALAFEPRDALCMMRAWITEMNANVLVWLTQFDALPHVLEPVLPCPTAADLTFALGPTQLGVYAVVPDVNWMTRLIALRVPIVQSRFKSDDT